MAGPAGRRWSIHGPPPDWWNTYAAADGLGANTVYGVYAKGGYPSQPVYAATLGGLSISHNYGPNEPVFFTNYTVVDGLGANKVFGVYADGATVYAATAFGLSISFDDAATWTPYYTSDGLGDNQLLGVYAQGATIYAATGPADYDPNGGGLSIGVGPPY